MISLIAFITATCGFLNEMNFAQTLTAVMGGTVLRYQTTFGLFSFSLGLGAWLFDYCNKWWSARRILLLSQILMTILSVASPSWIRLFNPLTHPQSLFVFTLLCYMPIVLVGITSGLELPSLLALNRTHKQKRFSPLAWDYAGMFVASAAFPAFLLYSLGVNGVGLLAMTLSAIACALVHFAVPEDNHHAISNPVSSPKHMALLAAIFLLSFCSFSYELLLAKIMGDLIHEETLAYSLGVGFMLIGLGWGTFLAQNSKSALKTLIIVEILLIGLGSSLYALFYGIGTWIHAYPPLQVITTSKWLGLFVFSPLPLAIGVLTGFELPLCLKMMGSGDRELEPTSDNISIGIAMNYLGALGAGLCVPLFLLPHWGPSSSLHFVALINVLVLFGFLIFRPSLPASLRILAGFATCTLTVLSVRTDRFVESLFLKTYYYDLNITSLGSDALRGYLRMARSIEDVQRETTAYQFIDKIKTLRPNSYFSREGFTLFLNKQQQVDSRYWRTYHNSFVLAPQILSTTSPRRVLICGGGDGLLARVLLEKTQVEHITLVELDPRMLELSRTDADLLAINQNALENPKVQVIAGDAYAFLFQTTETFDAIYMDFPYPDTFELSRLYSLEIYQAARARLNPLGFLILDAPIWRFVDRELKETPIELRVLKDTLHASGFAAVFAFGPNEPFIFATSTSQTLAFDYSKVPEKLDNASFTNLASLSFLELEDRKTQKPLVNSIYKPQPFFKQ